MPNYDYKCQKCRRVTEVFQSITAKPLTKCPRPKCGGKVTRLMGAGGGFLFKGGGFYITDYRSKKYQDAKKRDEQAKNSSSTPSTPSSSSGSGPSSGSGKS